MGHTVQEWTSPHAVTLTVDPAGLIVEAAGDSIDASGKTIVWAGLSQAEIARILGRGQAQAITRPSGSGVISIGRVEVARILTYENHGVRFELTLRDDSLAHVRALTSPSR